MESQPHRRIGWLPVVSLSLAILGIFASPFVFVPLSVARIWPAWQVSVGTLTGLGMGLSLAALTTGVVCRRRGGQRRRIAVAAIAISSLALVSGLCWFLGSILLLASWPVGLVTCNAETGQHRALGSD
jgi:hypothetical protein